MRYGSLLFALFSIVRPASGAPMQANARVFDLEYGINIAAMPLNSVTLWYTLDRGQSWQEYGSDPDARPPMTFEAPGEGLYGFYIIAANRTGPSSAPPNSSTPPHMWVFVDYTPPVVQFHPLRMARYAEGYVLQIRWTTVDAHFDTRPVTVEYQRATDQGWSSLTAAPLPNTGQYDWLVPRGLAGPIRLRVVVRDRGGHVATSPLQTMDIPQAQLSLSPIPQAPGSGLSDERPYPQQMRGTASASTTVLPGSQLARERAARLASEAQTLQSQGELRAGIIRLREAVRLNPQDPHSFAALADMLYGVGDYDSALEAYHLALQHDPSLRGALRGAAQVYRRRNDFASSANLLRTILRYNPNDAEVWMNLGDVAIYQGDEVLARECYIRASQADPTATHIAIEAQKRLSVMSDVSRRFFDRGP